MADGARAPLPRVWPTVVHMLADAAVLRPDALALVCGDDRLDYRAYAACVAGLAAELNATGVGAGARVVLLMGNSADIATPQLYPHRDFQHRAKVYDAAHPRAKRKKGSPE